MTLRRAVFSAALAVGFTALPAAGQLYQWNQQCVPGAPQACMNIRLQIDYQASLFGGLGGTEFSYWFQNLQGAELSGSDSPFGFLGIMATGVDVPSVLGHGSWNQDPCHGCEYTEGGAALEGHWAIFGNRPGAFMGAGRHPYDLLWGCEIPGTVPGPHADTCGGAMSVDFAMAGEWSLSDRSELSIRGFDHAGGGDGVFVSCVLGRTCVGVPEPGSWLLLLTGVLGLGSVAVRRGGTVHAGPHRSL